MFIRPTAQKGILPYSESELTVVVRGFLSLTEYSPSFPNPIPINTRVPNWALIDITVRHLSFVDAAY
jgi:hypothetical protein